MGEVKRCAACGKENPVNEMKVCMHHQMHRYVCDSKCMTDFYNLPKKPTAAELEARVATLEAENAKLREALERRAVPDDHTEQALVMVPNGCLIAPIQPTEEMRKRAQDYLAAEGMIASDWLIHTSYTEMLAAAPSAPKADAVRASLSADNQRITPPDPIIAERDATIERLEAGIPRLQEQAYQMRQQRDKLAGLLDEVTDDFVVNYLDADLIKRIDAALAEVDK